MGAGMMPEDFLQWPALMSCQPVWILIPQTDLSSLSTMLSWTTTFNFSTSTYQMSSWISRQAQLWWCFTGWIFSGLVFSGWIRGHCWNYSEWIHRLQKLIFFTLGWRIEVRSVLRFKGNPHLPYLASCVHLRFVQCTELHSSQCERRRHSESGCITLQ